MVYLGLLSFASVIAQSGSLRAELVGAQFYHGDDGGWCDNAIVLVLKFDVPNVNPADLILIQSNGEDFLYPSFISVTDEDGFAQFGLCHNKNSFPMTVKARFYTNTEKLSNIMEYTLDLEKANIQTYEAYLAQRERLDWFTNNMRAR